VRQTLRKALQAAKVVRAALVSALLQAAKG
jgi:hypothetical protein